MNYLIFKKKLKSFQQFLKIKKSNDQVNYAKIVSMSFLLYKMDTILTNPKNSTPIKDMITLRAQVIEHHKRKIIMSCTLESSGRITVEAEVVAIQVYDSSKNNETNQFE